MESKIWVTRNDYRGLCTGKRESLAYLETPARLDSLDVKWSGNRNKMGENDCLIHFCEEEFDYYLQNQLSGCNHIEGQRVNNNIITLVDAFLHELV